MNAPLAILDEATIRRIIQEEVSAALAPLFEAIRKVPAESPARPDMLTREDLAAMLGIGSRTLRRMELAGLLPPPIRASRRAVWWPRSTITAWMNSGGHIRARATLSIRGRRG